MAQEPQSKPPLKFLDEHDFENRWLMLYMIHIDQTQSCHQSVYWSDTFWVSQDENLAQSCKSLKTFRNWFKIKAKLLQLKFKKYLKLYLINRCEIRATAWHKFLLQHCSKAMEVQRYKNFIASCKCDVIYECCLWIYCKTFHSAASEHKLHHA